MPPLKGIPAGGDHIDEIADIEFAIGQRNGHLLQE
jgi:hypothetical protein